MMNKINFYTVFLLFFIVSCSAGTRFSTGRPVKDSSSVKPAQNSDRFTEGQILKGECSYYGTKFHGHKTANGETFNMYKLTAAHKKLPFGTILEVENLKNGKKVRVRINDRGPFKKNRIIDLSYAAAEIIGLLKTGVTTVKAKIIKLGVS